MGEKSDATVSLDAMLPDLLKALEDVQVVLDEAAFQASQVAAEIMDLKQRLTELKQQSATGGESSYLGRED